MKVGDKCMIKYYEKLSSLSNVPPDAIVNLMHIYDTGYCQIEYSGSCYYIHEGMLIPYIESEKPWVVLRKAAEVYRDNGKTLDALDLEGEAWRLEAFATTKPPTLLEAAEKVCSDMRDISDGGRLFGSVKVLAEAIEREKAKS